MDTKKQKCVLKTVNDEIQNKVKNGKCLFNGKIECKNNYGNRYHEYYCIECQNLPDMELPIKAPDKSDNYTNGLEYVLRMALSSQRRKEAHKNLISADKVAKSKYGKAFGFVKAPESYGLGKNVFIEGPGTPKGDHGFWSQEESGEIKYIAEPYECLNTENLKDLLSFCDKFGYNIEISGRSAHAVGHTLKLTYSLKQPEV